MTVESMQHLILAIVKSRREIYLSELLEFCGPEARGDRQLIGHSEKQESIVLQEGVSPLYTRAFAAAKKYDMHIYYDVSHGSAVSGYMARIRMPQDIQR